MISKSSLKLFASVFIALTLIIVSACSSNPVSNSSEANQNAEKSASQNADSSNSSGSQNQTGKSINVTFFASPSRNVIDLKTNWFTQYVEKQFNLKINWLITPASDVTTKQPLLLGSGDYPEVFWNGNFSPSDILKYSQQGILIPLNDLIKQYAPNVQKAIDTIPGLKEISMAPDGNIYGLPNYNWCFHCFWSSKFWINTKLLQDNGLQMPTTTEEFEHVLQVFKDKGLIPLTGSVDGWHQDPTVFLMNAFIYNNGTDYLDVSNGQVRFSPAQPEWKEGLQYIHELYAKGLLDQQALTQKQDIVIRDLSQHKAGVVAAGGSNNVIENGDANPEFKYWLSVPPLKGPNGVQYAGFFGNAPNTLTFAITNRATKEQEIALMKLLNFIWTPEGTQILDFGQEGTYWKKSNQNELGLDGKPGLFNTDWNKFYSGNARQNDGWDQMGPIFQSMEWRNGGVAIPPFGPGGAQTLLHLETMRNYAGHQPKQVYPGAVWIPVDQNQQYAMYKTNINKYVQQWSTEFIAGTKSIDKDWASYLKGLEGLGLKQFIEMSQKYMGKPFDTSSFQSDPSVVDYLLKLK
ncbi:extracellular solute-binding protein [Paenibacillus filicis]|uniref:Extracellular solute-binding protein n=1 Tax=Paenibacillus gyeongsangnamensis TaxID=3388067 RepID=A0ABT4QCZ7_9BACL|nr:extracellular solute-binding protein [Paenibacillus filicis]MCZ8514758.1 extracellular solute-binding protein [Paenibacillus filicis]